MGQFENLSQAFEKKLKEDEDFKKKFSEGIVASLKESGLKSPSPEEEELIMREPLAKAVGKEQVITAEAFWWGYHFVIPEAAMKDFLAGGDVLAKFMALGGTIITASGGSLAPLVAVMGAYVIVELTLMKAIDRGKGVYLSAIWASPALIVPTPI